MQQRVFKNADIVTWKRWKTEPWNNEREQRGWILLRHHHIPFTSLLFIPLSHFIGRLHLGHAGAFGLIRPRPMAYWTAFSSVSMLRANAKMFIWFERTLVQTPNEESIPFIPGILRVIRANYDCVSKGFFGDTSNSMLQPALSRVELYYVRTLFILFSGVSGRQF